METHLKVTCRWNASRRQVDVKIENTKKVLYFLVFASQRPSSLETSKVWLLRESGAELGARS